MISMLLPVVSSSVTKCREKAAMSVLNHIPSPNRVHQSAERITAPAGISLSFSKGSPTPVPQAGLEFF